MPALFPAHCRISAIESNQAWEILRESTPREPGRKNYQKRRVETVSHSHRSRGPTAPFRSCAPAAGTIRWSIPLAIAFGHRQIANRWEERITERLWDAACTSIPAQFLHHNMTENRVRILA